MSSKRLPTHNRNTSHEFVFEGFDSKQDLLLYKKIKDLSVDVLCEFVIAKLLDRPLELNHWSRKVFKVYKTLNNLEKKKTEKPYFCRHLFKLIFVLFRLKKGETDLEAIWNQMNMQADQEQRSSGDRIRDNDSRVDSAQARGILSDTASHFSRADNLRFTTTSAFKEVNSRHRIYETEEGGTVDHHESKSFKSNNAPSHQMILTKHQSANEISNVEGKEGDTKNGGS